MPFRDGTGPAGYGAGTGRGMGGCFGANTVANTAQFGPGMHRGRGCGHGRGYGYRFVPAQSSAETQRAILVERKRMLEEQLAAVNKRLECASE